jgi:hypothetical protein
MNILKTFIIFLISFPTLLFACVDFGYGTYYIQHGYNILPKQLLSHEFRQATRSNEMSFYVDKEFDQRDVTKKVNLAEWAKFLKRPEKEVEAIIYQKQMSKRLDSDTKAYLNFVHRVEPLVDFDNQWERSKNTQLDDDYKQAISDAEVGIATAKKPFLKLRYLFSAMRLAHYSKHYTIEERLYQSHANSLQNVDSEVWQWIDALKAGMDKQKGKRVEAAYQFAQIFARSKTKRYSAYIDFSIKSDQEWQSLMSMCKDNNEKALMHFLRALTPKANSLQELQTIYQIAPNSVWLDALLTRELEYVQFAKYERDSLSQNNESIVGINKTMLIDDIERYGISDQLKLKDQLTQRRSSYINTLSDIVSKIRSENKHKDLFTADFAEVYLRLLKQETVHIHDVGQLELRYAKDPRVNYIQALKLWVYLENLPTINAAIEAEISIYLKKIQQYESGGVNLKDVMAYTYSKLSPLYAKQKASFKTYISTQAGIFDPDSIHVFEVRGLHALFSKKDRNFLETQMLISANEFLKYGHNLNEIMAKKYLSAGLFQQANQLLADLPKKTESQYNVFDNVLSGNNKDKSKATSSKVTVKKLAELQNKTKLQPDDANAHYLLANAVYNMSWFGNSPMLTRYSRSTSTWKRGEINLDKAKKHYQTALNTASDEELKAKILYGLAKIEFAEKYMQADEKGNGFSSYSFEKLERKASIEKLKAEDFGKYFKKLAQYKDTQYYREVIQQCNIYNQSSW